MNNYSLYDWEFEFLSPQFTYNFLKPARKVELESQCKLPKVGDGVYLHQTEALPIGTVLKTAAGKLYARSSRYSDNSSGFLVSLDGEPSGKWLDKMTIQYLPEGPKSFKVGDTVSHAQAQTLPVGTTMVYVPDEWAKRYLNAGSSDRAPSYYFVTNSVTSARCGVVRSAVGNGDSWSSYYKIVFMP